MARSSPKHTPTRRRLLAGVCGSAIAAPVSGCDLLSTDPAGDERQPDGGDDGAQAPMLARRVRGDELPPLTKRLPAEPLTVRPTDSPGSYGGGARLPLTGPTAPIVYLTIGYEGLVRWDENWEDVVPNVAKSFEVSGDGREFIFELRDGMRWSDGEPFTADDVVFAYEDILSVTELVPEMPSWLVAGGEPAALESDNAHSIRFVFAEPNGLFLQRLATPAGNVLTAFQRAHFSRFHRGHNSDADELAEQEGFSDWVDLFAAKGGTVDGMVDAGFWQNPETPTLCAWVLRAPIADETVTVAERNPYYAKVDTEGRQLPYLDEVSFELIESEETILLKATNGEIDTADFWDPFTLSNKPVFARNQEPGDYQVIDVLPASMNQMVIALNLTHEDPQMREVFQNRDFRIGLSHAIDRAEIIETVFQRQGEPWQACPREESAYFLQELAKQYTEYDVDLANSHLDRSGYTETDEDGFRLRRDGERIRFQVETTGPPVSQALELVRDYWRVVGVDIVVETEGRDLFYERKAANEHDANAWNGDGGLQDALLDPRWYFPSHSGESNFAIPWATWYETGGQDGEEPPEAPRRQMQLYDQLQHSTDADERDELFMQILRIAQEEFYVIGTVLPLGHYGIVPNGLRNVPEPVVRAWLNPNPGSTRPEQFFWDPETDAED